MILLTGATGFLGKHVARKLEINKIDYFPTSYSLGCDLRDRVETFKLFKKVKPHAIINCASFVGGIQYGYKKPVELFHNNLLMVNNLLEAFHKYDAKKFICPISNCVYPASSKLFKEDEIWNGPMHESVLVYGFVRKAFIVGAYAYGKQYGNKIYNIVLSNMYGPGDHFEEERSHALGALIMKFVKAKENNDSEVIVWGTGVPVREWLYVEDGAEALIRSLDIPYQNGPINVGIASGVSIKEMAEMIKRYVGYEGRIVFDATKPDGAAYKTVDGSLGKRLMGWCPSYDFENGVKETIQWYIKNRNERNYL